MFDLWTHHKEGRCFCLDCRSTRWCAGWMVGTSTALIGELVRTHAAPSFWFASCGGLVLTAILDVITVWAEEETDDDGTAY